MTIPRYLQDRREQKQHYVEENHFLHQEALTEAPNHRCEQCLLDYATPT